MALKIQPKCPRVVEAPAWVISRVIAYIHIQVTWALYFLLRIPGQLGRVLAAYSGYSGRRPRQRQRVGACVWEWATPKDERPNLLFNPLPSTLALT
jgi:hypothetical protein